MDIPVHPVAAIPDGQQTALVENIRITPAGTAPSTAADTGRTRREPADRAIGADTSGDILFAVLAKAGIGTELMLRKKDQPIGVLVRSGFPGVLGEDLERLAGRLGLHTQTVHDR